MQGSKKNNKSIDKRAVLVTVAVAIVFLLIGYYGRMLYDNRQDDRAKAVALESINHIISGDLASAYALSSDELIQAQTQEEFEAAMSGLTSEDPRPLEAQLLRGQGKILVQQYVENLPPTSTGKTSGDFYVTMVKEGPSWKVASISVQ